MDSEVSGISSTGTQTDSTEAQTEQRKVETDPVKISSAEDDSRNLLTPSLFVSLPLQYFLKRSFIQH